MFIFDLKDFRKGSSFAVPVTEERMLEALDEAGVTFDTPLSIRLRIKDMDTRMIVVKADLVDKVGDEIRLNIYVPPVGDEAPSQELADPYLMALNGQIRHQLAHIRQARTEGGMEEQTQETLDAWETEANMLTLEGKVNLVPCLGNLTE